MRTGVRAAAAFLILVTMSAPGRSGEDEPEGFLQARPGYRFRFPRDHASHPGYKTEWWYYSGHLKAATGEDFGFQLTFFRSGLRPPPAPGGSAPSAPRSRWAVRDIYFAHFAVADHRRRTFFFDERMSRGSLGGAGATTEKFRVWVAGWSARAL
ncbi:MAG: lipocalin-like domain-containing protein, partial [Nitrospinota bacterium]